MAIPQRQFSSSEGFPQAESQRIKIGIKIAKERQLAIPDHSTSKPKDERNENEYCTEVREITSDGTG